MNSFLEDLAARRRFGIRPGLDTIRAICSALGDPQKRLRAIHIAGTNGKGAVAAILDSCLRSAGFRVGRYTSPHLVRINERFMLDGTPVSDDKLEKYSKIVQNALIHWGQTPQNQGLSPSNQRGQTPSNQGLSPIDSGCRSWGQTLQEPTFFEALTAVAFAMYADESPDFVVLETGLGGRLDATNICELVISVITRIGLDHCDWLGDTVEKIAAEKAGIIKPRVPVVLGANVPEVVAIVKARAEEVGAPFFYAPKIADESEIPSDFSLHGSFNRENAVTAIAALKVLGSLGSVLGSLGSIGVSLGSLGSIGVSLESLGSIGASLKSIGSIGSLSTDLRKGFSKVVWPGRFQRVGRFIVDGAHNPPAARALVAALQELMGTVPTTKGSVPATSNPRLTLIAGFCADKDVDETLRILAPIVWRAIAVRTVNPRSLSPEELKAKMQLAGIEAEACDSLRLAIDRVGSVPSVGVGSVPTTWGSVPSVGVGSVPTTWGSVPRGGAGTGPDVLICGSLFLAGEALVALGAYPWQADRFDAAELPR